MSKSPKTQIVTLSLISVNSIPYLVIFKGSGKGYLSHVLAHEYDLNVLGIDNKEIVTRGAAQRKKQIEKNTKKETKFQPITSHLSLDLNVPQFLEILSPLKTKKERMVLIGLHTCGDLASTILKLYVNMPLCKALINVGCCYHLLTENGNNVNVGFPLSKFVQKYGISLTSGGIFKFYVNFHFRKDSRCDHDGTLVSRRR